MDTSRDAATANALTVVWFKRDLRVHDHRPLARAAATGAVLPLYIAEPALWQQPDASARQWAFARESLAELREALGALGQPLVVRVGDAVEVLEAFRRSHGIKALWSHQETGNDWTYRRDRAVGAWCRKHGIPWREPPQGGVIRRLQSRDGWAGRWNRAMAQRPSTPPVAVKPLRAIDPGALPTDRDLGLEPDPCPGRQAGGRAAGLDTLDGFLNRRGEYYQSEMSSPNTAWTACSRMSPPLAWGTVSMREIAHATRERRAELTAAADGHGDDWRRSLGSFSGRLHWHCHFMQKLEDEPRLEFDDLHPSYAGLRPAEPDTATLGAWANGETGLPFVDACMRALKHDGWMNFRMRAMLMAVSSYHLWLDWRKPGEHLARCFTDYEPGIHWPQVQMQSGTTGINTVRIYNPVKQGYDQDPDGVFVRRWLPELADIPDGFIHEPWKWPDSGKVLGKRYPAPIVDHLAAARVAKGKIYGARRSTGFRDTAARIHERHGSRRRARR